MSKRPFEEIEGVVKAKSNPSKDSQAYGRVYS